MTPSATSPARRSMPGFRAATWIGTGPSGAAWRRKRCEARVSPSYAVFPPASIARITSTCSRIRLRGRS